MAYLDLSFASGAGMQVVAPAEPARLEPVELQAVLLAGADSLSRTGANESVELHDDLAFALVRADS